MYRDIISKIRHTIATLLEQVDDFARVDEADQRKREETKRSDKGKGKEQDHRSGGRSVLDRLGCSQSTIAYSAKRESFIPLLKSPREIYTLTKGKGILRQPLKMQTSSHRRNKENYCEYHEDHGHRMDDCNYLKREIELCVQNGQLSRFVKDVRKTDYRRDRENNRGRDRQYEHSRS